jgi:hypothetical protein
MSYYNVATLEEPMEEPAQFSNHWVDQQPVIVSGETAIITADLFIEAAPVPGTETVPASFWNALADFATGRVVDDQIALNQPLPGA